MTNVRRIARHALAALALVAALSGALFIASPAQAAPAAHAAPVAPATGVFCQCTDFVANSYGLPHTYPDAKYWGNWLHGIGWRVETVPHVYDIIVMQPGTYGAYPYGMKVDSPGHVAIVAPGTYQNSNGTWHVQVQGANQGGSTYDPISGCSNTNTLTVTPMSYGAGIAFYYHP